MISTQDLKDLKLRAKRAFNVRDSHHRPLWRDAAKFLSPSHGRFLEGNNSQPMAIASRKHLVADAAARARQICTSGFKGSLVPHTLEWFRVGLVDEEMQKWRPARIWLQEVQRILYDTFSRSNFYSAISSPLNEQILFSTGALATLPHPKKGLHFAPWTIGEYTIACNEFGEVDTAFRTIWRTAHQLQLQFGLEHLTNTTQTLIRNNQADTFVQMTMAITPRGYFNPEKMDSANMPVAAYYWEEKGNTDHLLGEEGYHSYPVQFPRWDTIGEDPWGVDSPGLLSLGDVKQLQVMEHQSMKQTELQGAPPMNIPMSFKGRLSMQPNAQNYVPDGAGSAKVEPTFNLKADIGAIDQKSLRIEQRIDKAFYNDLFLMLMNGDGGAKTAFEVAKKHEEKLMVLGSTVERQDSELLTPTLHRSIDVLAEAGRLPPAPEEIQDTDIKYDFVSVLAQAQKAVNSNKVIEFFNFVDMAKQINPNAVDKVDVDAAIDSFADNAGMSPKIVRSDDDANEDRAARAEAQQGEQQMQQAAGGAGIAKDLGSAVSGLEPGMVEKLTNSLPSL